MAPRKRPCVNTGTGSRNEPLAAVSAIGSIIGVWCKAGALGFTRAGFGY